MATRTPTTIIALAAILLSGPAFAGKDDPTWNPPAKYDHPYKGKLRVYYLPPKQVVTVCKKLIKSATLEQRGCAVHDDKSCTVIVVDKPYKGATPKAVLRHELGHCQGWPSHHPE